MSRAPTPAALRRATALSAAVAIVVVAGCVTPRRAIRDADRTAYQIIREKQQSALGKTEHFRLGPEDELRRRLLLDQQLPAGGAASYGRPYLPPVPKEPAGVSANLPLPPEANLVTGPRPRVKGVGRETLSTDVFLVDIGRNPESGAVPGERPPQRPLYGPPAPGDAPEPLMLTLLDALQIAARSSRDYQREKEDVFLAALDLDLERDRFEFRFSGTLDADVQTELEGEDTTGVVLSPALGVSKVFKSGALLTTRIGIDLAKLLTGSRAESLGVFADASITVPLLRGAGVEVVTENLQQAERDAIYAIWDFETFKREFAVQIVADYLGVLGDLNSVDNSEANYRRLVLSADRAAALFGEGRLPGIQVDQATQQALRAQERLLLARQRYEQRLDSFKVRLGLPPDARVVLDPAELENLTPLAQRVLGEGGTLPQSLRRGGATRPATQPATQPATRPAIDAGPALPDVQGELDPTTSGAQPQTSPSSMPTPADPSRLPAGVLGEVAQPDLPETGDSAELVREALRIALRNRLDLAVAYGEVVDAQRATVLAADDLEADLDLNAGAAYGSRRGALSGGQPDATLRLDEGSYSGGLAFDLPIERTGERNGYRQSLILLDRAVRAAQDAEDRVKLDVINSIRSLRVAAEDLRIQAVAIQVARRRVDSATLLLEVGRGQVRDLTEAEDALITAQNSFTGALIDYRLAQLELQRDLGILEVDENGLYREADELMPSP